MTLSEPGYEDLREVCSHLDRIENVSARVSAGAEWQGDENVSRSGLGEIPEFTR